MGVIKNKLVVMSARKSCVWNTFVYICFSFLSITDVFYLEITQARGSGVDIKAVENRMRNTPLLLFMRRGVPSKMPRCNKIHAN